MHDIASKATRRLKFELLPVRDDALSEAKFCKAENCDRRSFMHESENAFNFSAYCDKNRDEKAANGI